ncbi:unnamed protein product [Ilex paraguariensis]|uniref:Uncharacterized protein n=1 Tax=Ilex paraguariensis TaxID=185542 RepID=A0ABC8RK06_9AQUA
MLLSLFQVPLSILQFSPLMYSEFYWFSVMGMSNSDLFLSDKDLNAMECNFSSRVPLPEYQDECQIAPSEERELHQEIQQGEVEEREKEENCESLVSSLKIKFPSVGESKVDEEDDGFQTPKSTEHKIKSAEICPPAPRKPKTISSTTRKASRGTRRVLLDLTSEVESLYPPVLLADLGGKIKKVRKGSETPYDRC